MSSPHENTWLPPVLVLTLIVLQGSASAGQWTGAPWADYGPFLSPLTEPVKQHLRSVKAVGDSSGRVLGRVGQIGDSITESSAYFRNVVRFGPDSDETGHDYDPVRSWLSYSATQPADENSFYRDHGKGIPYGNRWGWELFDAVDAGHPTECVEVGDGSTPGEFSWALIQFGTNDIDEPNWNAATWKDDYSAFVQEFLDLGVVPVLSTIPPEVAHLGDGRVELANDAIRALAGELLVPYVDFHALVLHYQPANWHGTLISADGTHPSAAGGGRLFSQEGLTTTDGYAARSKLTFDMAEKIREIVFEDGAADPDPGSSAPLRPLDIRRSVSVAPNPFRNTTTIRWEGDGRLVVRDVRGRLIRDLATTRDGEITWDGRDGRGRTTSSGVYFVRLESPGSTHTQRIVRLR